MELGKFKDPDKEIKSLRGLDLAEAGQGEDSEASQDQFDQFAGKTNPQPVIFPQHDKPAVIHARTAAEEVAMRLPRPLPPIDASHQLHG